MEVFLPHLPTSTGLTERSDQHSTRPFAHPKGTGSGHRLTANKWLHQRRAYGQRLDGASPPPAKLARDSSEGLSGTEATCPRLVSYQEGLRFFEEGSREEPGRTLGRIVRDHGGSFPSTLTNLNRAYRKKRPALDQTFCAPEGYWVWPPADSQ